LDPNAKDPTGKSYHADSFINGIRAQTAAALDKEIQDNPGLKPVKPVYVKYDDGPRYVALYDLFNKNALTICHLYIGFEVSDKQGSAVDPDDWGIPFQVGLHHYHHVYLNGNKYHVVTKK
jgi:hypothetical protein